MERYGFSRITFLIGLVLGGLVERSFHQTLTAFGPGGFFTRPIADVLIVLVAAMLIVPPVRNLLRKRRSARTTTEVDA
jgi:putative tricarboxylic transport membrane protein